MDKEKQPRDADTSHGDDATSGDVAQTTQQVVDADLIPPLHAVVAPDVPRKRGRPKGSTKQARALNPAPPGETPNVQRAADPAPSAPFDYNELAAPLTNTFFSLCVGIFGDEWKPAVSEAENIQNALARYLRAKNMPDLPPGWILAIAVSGYAAPRFTRPQTQAKISSWVRKTKKLVTTNYPDM